MCNEKGKKSIYKRFDIGVDFEEDDEEKFFSELINEKKDDERLRKSISKKILSKDRLTIKEYMKLLEYALEECKSLFTLDSYNKKYEIIFRERENSKEDKER